MNFRADPIKFESLCHFQFADRIKFTSSRTRISGRDPLRPTDRQKFGWEPTEFDRSPTEFLVTA